MTQHRLNPSVTRSPAASSIEAGRVVAALYLCVLTVFLAALGRANLTEKDPWSVGDWLINYQGGFVRRGLPGEMAYRLGGLLHVSAPAIVLLLQAALYGFLLLSVWRLINLSSCSSWIAAFLFSPATLSFAILDACGGFRKEILLLAGLALLIRMLRRTGTDRMVLALYLAAATVLLVLSHEALVLFLPYWFAVLAIARRSLKQAALLMLPAAVLGLVCWIAVLSHAGNAAAVQHICASLGADGKDYCSGAIASLAQNKAYARTQVLKTITLFHPVGLFGGLAMLGLLPAVVPLAALWRHQGRHQETRRTFWITVACGLLSVALTSTLFIYAVDWGRWIYIHVFSLFLVLLFVDIQHGQIANVKVQSARWWCYPLLLMYAATWALPRTPGPSPTSTSYLGHCHFRWMPAAYR